MVVTTRERLSALIHELRDICDALIPQLDNGAAGLEYDVASAHSLLALLGEIQYIVATYAQITAHTHKPGDN